MGANQSRPPTPPPTPPSPGSVAEKPDITFTELKRFLLAGRRREDKYHIPEFGEVEVDCGDVSLLKVEVGPEVALAVLEDAEVDEETEYIIGYDSLSETFTAMMGGQDLFTVGHKWFSGIWYSMHTSRWVDPMHMWDMNLQDGMDICTNFTGPYTSSFASAAAAFCPSGSGSRMPTIACEVLVISSPSLAASLTEAKKHLWIHGSAETEVFFCITFHLRDFQGGAAQAVAGSVEAWGRDEDGRNVVKILDSTDLFHERAVVSVAREQLWGPYMPPLIGTQRPEDLWNFDTKELGTLARKAAFDDYDIVPL